MAKSTYKGGSSVYTFDTFKGVDYAHSSGNVSTQRSTDGLNMVRSEVGKVRKRTGYQLDEKQWEGNINGIHFYVTGEGTQCIIHCKNTFYIQGEPVWQTANDDFSRSVQIGKCLYIVDGKNFLVYDGESFSAVREKAYVPVVYVHRTPCGGGQPYEQVNILTDKRKESFISDGESIEYLLSRKNVGEGPVSALIFSADGNSTEIKENNGFTVNRAAGIITFSSPPPISRDGNEDNVYIEYEKAAENADLSPEGCTVITAFGKGGRQDTLFLSGSKAHPGRQWFSSAGNPFLFGNDSTQIIGGDNSDIMGYSRSADKLFVHKNTGGISRNIFVLECRGSDENFYSYQVSSTMHGPPAIAKSSFVNLTNDPLFLTDSGVYAITKNEYRQRYYTQLRSFYINPSLLSAKSLENARAVAFNDFYVIALGQEIYLLDSLQKSFELDKEYSNFQYEAYHWKIDRRIRLLFVQEGRLCFADMDGRIGRFYEDFLSPASYNDRGQPITAVWQTGDFKDNTAAEEKNIYRLWAVCDVSLRTSVKAFAQIKGIWRQMFYDDTTCRYFKWSDIQWSKFTWSCDKTPKTISRSVRIKGVNKTAFRFENDSINEPFGLSEIGIEYTKGRFYR